MLQSWHNFFFVSYDPGGFVTIDKPPLGFWVQAGVAKLFGYSGIAMIAPQAVAGVLCVALLYYLVARSFGFSAGILAALALAVTPISVVGGRSNNIDMQLVLMVLLAAWAVIKATETGRLRWLLLTAVLLGLGFNIKTMQAYLVLPACALLYAVAAPNHWKTRLAHLGLATVVLLVVSFSWITAVDLTPASQRPYVGSSCTNSELNLALGYNGLGRLTGGIFTTCAASEAAQNDTSTQNTGTQTTGGNPGAPTAGPRGGGGPGGFGENGAKGPFRLFNESLGGQIAWLLPLALIGLIVGLMQTARREVLDRRRIRLALDPRQQSLVFWGAWLLVQAAFFSVAGFFHSYYMVMLAPAVAALSGIGATVLWQTYRRGGWRLWLLPLSLVGVAAVQAYLLEPYPDWSRWLTPLVVSLAVVAAVLLLVARLGMRRARQVRPAIVLAFGAAVVGLLSLFIAPSVWAAYTAQHGTGGGLGQAGPRAQGGFGGFGRGFDGGNRGGSRGGNGFGFGAPRGGSAGGNGNAGSGSAGGSGSGGSGGNGFGTGNNGGSGFSSGGSGFGGPGASGTPGSAQGASRGRGDFGEQVNQQLLGYLEQHQGTTKFLLAVTNSMAADPYIIQTGKPVMALGGFAGSDKIITAAQLAQLVKNNTVRYFLLGGPGGGAGGRGFTLSPQMLDQLPPAMREQIESRLKSFGGGRGFGGFGGRGDVNADLMTWVSQHCAVVPASAYGSSTGSSEGFGGFGGFGGGNTLYDCAATPAAQSQSTQSTGTAPASDQVATGPLPALSAAMAKVSSYQATISTSTIGGAGLMSGMGSTSTLTAVRQGSGFVDYTVTRSNTPFGARTIETVTGNGQVCTRNSASATFTCHSLATGAQDNQSGGFGGPGGSDDGPVGGRGAPLGGQGASPGGGSAGGSGGPSSGFGGQGNSQSGGFGAGGGQSGGFGGAGGSYGGHGGYGGKRGLFGGLGITADPSQDLRNATFTPVASKTIGSQTCAGYAHTLTTSTGETATGTLYVSHGRLVRCET
jgi:4-amino-4-deoxy-L-arabinose transferase-like glycosyltransferase